MTRKNRRRYGNVTSQDLQAKRFRREALSWQRAIHTLYWYGPQLDALLKNYEEAKAETAKAETAKAETGIMDCDECTDRIKEIKGLVADTVERINTNVKFETNRITAGRALSRVFEKYPTIKACCIDLNVVNSELEKYRNPEKKEKPIDEKE